MTPPVIRAYSLTKEYDGTRGVVELEFTVGRGEVFGFLGPNGAGKTTTIRLMLDLIRPTSGRIELFGLDARRESVAIRRRLGYVPGDLRLYEQLTGRELLAETYPEALKAFVAFGGEFDFSTPAGYLGVEIFSLLAPLLLLVAAIGAGARAMAGEEERGTLDLLLSAPVSRPRLAIEKLGALVVEVVGLGAVLWLSLAIGSQATAMHLSLGNLAAAVADAVLLAVAFGAIALLLGAATGRRGLATGLTAALAVTAYLLNSLAPLVHTLERIRTASPFYHYVAGDPLRHGFAVDHALVLAAIALVAGLLAPVFFDRRDLAV